MCKLQTNCEIIYDVQKINDLIFQSEKEFLLKNSTFSKKNYDSSVQHIKNIIEKYINKSQKDSSLREIFAKNGSFLDDSEKMFDFFPCSKDEFLFSYSYLNESDYDTSVNELKHILDLHIASLL